jgi:hypothetical protein
MTNLKLSTIVNGLLKDGYTPAQVRKELRRRGIAWSVSYPSHQGAREKGRRLKQQGLKACETCDATYPIAVSSPVCPGCLARKWAPGVLDSRPPDIGDID